ncbi:hypothetical protein [Microvirga yunnanensis]|uniref:hypothetical protein n=1 Tax=Microvirga yunnanensis TaxID=2953740 RepID=UPI0021C61FB8|nr:MULTISPECIES: hypothetical protein [unclassified Microvirga]
MDGTIEADDRTVSPTKGDNVSGELLVVLRSALRAGYEGIFCEDIPPALKGLVEDLEQQEREAMHASLR